MSNLLYSDKEVINLLEEGLTSELFHSMGELTTKREIFKEVRELMKGVDPQIARSLCALKVSQPEVSLVILLKIEKQGFGRFVECQKNLVGGHR